MVILLGDIANRIGAELQGDPDLAIEDIAPLDRATGREISFLSSRRFLPSLAATDAAAVILSPEYRDRFSGNRLLLDDPYLGYAKAAALLHPTGFSESGCAPSAEIHPSAVVGEGGWIGENCVVMAGAKIGDGVYIGAGTVVGTKCRVGDRSRLVANVTLTGDTVIGEECLLHPGAVLGSDGFGFANESGRWLKIPQLGRVVVGDRVEIGANSTIDRGALEDTVIGDGVKIDNLVHIAHNVRIGENSAMAAMVGIAGSTVIGADCSLGGQVGVVGHIEIADGVSCTARTLVTGSIKEPGLYSSATSAEPNRRWRRNVVQFKRLNESVQRLRALEKRVENMERK